MYSKLFEKLSKHKAVSFDIFDTLIIRKCGKPHYVFDIVEKKFNEKNKDSYLSFKEIRIQSEIEARRSKNGSEISFQEIYDIVSQYLGKEKTLTLMKLEKETELEQCIANKEIVDLYHKLLLHNDVYIVSDMYFDCNFIIHLLKSCKIELPKKIYVSVEYNATKRNKKLFRHLLDDNTINPHDITHIGDNFRSDYINPKLLGMHSIWIK